VGEHGRQGDELIDHVVDELRSPVPMRADQVDRIMAVVRADGRARARRRVWAWGGGVAAVVGTAAALLLVMPRTAHAPGRAVAPVTPVAPVAALGEPTVEFALLAGTAREVVVVGDFNHWDVHATPLVRPSGNGEWHTAVRLAPGRHVYAFVVDGTRWVPDPSAPRAIDDDFGAPNSVVMVPPTHGAT
jgi:Glycogen recognition site of AMP-activated protein kinase